MSEQNFIDTGALTIYARVQGNQVIEYPVTNATIEARGHSVNQYYPVRITEDTFSDEAGKIAVREIKVENGWVVVNNSVRDKTLEEAISFFRKSYEEDKWIPYTSKEVPIGELNYFQTKLAEEAEARLEAVVKERYSSLDTLLGRYANSSNPVWKKEAAFIQAALDALWARLLEYFHGLSVGITPLPVDASELKELMKAPSWSEMQ